MNERNNTGSIRRWCSDWVTWWDRFWFQPRSAATLALMRILAGLILVYTHFVWGLELETFFSPDGVIGTTFHRELHGNSPFVWSHFDWVDSSSYRFGMHLLALAAMVAFTAGWKTRLSGIVSAFFTISYAHRATGAMFGLDQINCFLAMYLAISPCGKMYSIDAWRSGRPVAGAGDISPESSTRRYVMATVATRLIQVHLCIVYLFAGFGKLQGPSWWDGTAIWGAVASYEYQTVDLTFLAHWVWLANLITLITLFWECSYPFLIWPKLTRPIWLAMAVAVHLGIGLAMGMLTFGFVMVVANMSFVEPALIDGLFGRLGRGNQAGQKEP